MSHECDRQREPPLARPALKRYVCMCVRAVIEPSSVVEISSTRTRRQRVSSTGTQSHQLQIILSTSLISYRSSPLPVLSATDHPLYQSHQLQIIPSTKSKNFNTSRQCLAIFSEWFKHSFVEHWTVQNMTWGIGSLHECCKRQTEPNWSYIRRVPRYFIYIESERKMGFFWDFRLTSPVKF